jgi:hypothetical protein
MTCSSGVLQRRADETEYGSHIWLSDQGYFGAAGEPGAFVERLVEPRPVPEAAAINPEEYERLAREPRGFIAFRLRPRP